MSEPEDRPARRPVRRRRDDLPVVTSPAEAGSPPEDRPVLIDDHHDENDPGATRRAERLVTALFTLAILGTAIFVFGYVYFQVHTSSYGESQNLVLGTGLTISLLAVGAGFVVWAKKLVTNSKATQERHPQHSPEEDELAAEEMFLAGADDLGIGKYRTVRRSLLAAMAILPIPALVLLRDMGPLPRKRLRQTAWKKGIRLVDVDTGRPIKFGDLDVGGQLTVVPEGHTDLTVPINAVSPVNLIRMPPGRNHPVKGRENWAYKDHVAYSEICTHVGCPVRLYEQQTQHLLCPCHQSTFDLTHGCKVLFGPAARALPQLPIGVDPNGYFVAKAGFDQPVGPSFWERG